MIQESPNDIEIQYNVSSLKLPDKNKIYNYECYRYYPGSYSCGGRN